MVSFRTVGCVCRDFILVQGVACMIRIIFVAMFFELQCLTLCMQRTSIGRSIGSRSNHNPLSVCSFVLFVLRTGFRFHSNAFVSAHLHLIVRCVCFGIPFHIALRS